MRDRGTRFTARRINVREERVKGSTSGAHYADLAARAKSNSAISPYCVPNEFIYQKLGDWLGLPVAGGIVIEREWDDQNFLYAAFDFSQDGERFPPVVPEDCVMALPTVCTGIVLFDIFIANSDRSRNNLFFDADSQTPYLLLFDHECALLGATANQAEARLTGSVKNHLGIPGHCLKSLTSVQSLMESAWMQRINNLPDYLIEDVCREAAPYGMTPPETDAVIAFLSERRSSLLSLIQRHKSEFAE